MAHYWSMKSRVYGKVVHKCTQKYRDVWVSGASKLHFRPRWYIY